MNMSLTPMMIIKKFDNRNDDNDDDLGDVSGLRHINYTQ